MIRVLIVDDHDLVREGLRALLEKDPMFEVVGGTGDGQAAIRLAEAKQPDVILMDINLPPGIGGLEASAAILAHNRNARIIILTQYENREYIRRAFQLGARGYLPKRSLSAELKEAVKTVHAGHRYVHPAAADDLVDLLANRGSVAEDEYERLTPREKQVFKLVAEGKSSREVADYLGIGIKTAMTHRTNLMAKLSLHSRSELIRYAIRKAVIQIDD